MLGGTTPVTDADQVRAPAARPGTPRTTGRRRTTGWASVQDSPTAPAAGVGPSADSADIRRDPRGGRSRTAGAAARRRHRPPVDHAHETDREWDGPFATAPAYAERYDDGTGARSGPRPKPYEFAGASAAQLVVPDADAGAIAPGTGADAYREPSPPSTPPTSDPTTPATPPADPASPAPDTPALIRRPATGLRTGVRRRGVVCRRRSAAGSRPPSAGTSGAGGRLFEPVEVAESRTNCLS